MPLNDAFAINDIKEVCRAQDKCVTGSSSITRVANATGLDRTRLCRTFRLKSGPSLDTALRVIEVLEYRLIVLGRSKSVSKTYVSRETIYRLFTRKVAPHWART
jgi:DNA-binding phage protein